jgi:methylenetetrahydrofolate dehydrogenase (NADP+)/methenyltetrahydrofolate cyclohydrolase
MISTNEIKKKTNIINGHKIAAQLKHDLAQKIKTLKTKPQLAVILVGDDPSSKIYISLKEKACMDVGIKIIKYVFSKKTSSKQIKQIIKKLNHDDSINGILIQLPLPNKFNTQETIKSIDPLKDVDGFHPTNIKRFLKDQTLIIPGLANSVSSLLLSAEINLKNKQALIISNSKVFSIPIIKILKNLDCKAKWISPNNKQLKKQTKIADIIIIAIGRPKFLKKDMIKKNAVIIDVGINKLPSGQIVGDCDFKNLLNKASHITPVPGGVGPVTIALLLKNTFKLYNLQKKIKKTKTYKQKINE